MNDSAHLIRAFWLSVDKQGLNGCWLWTGRKTSTGYGWCNADQSYGPNTLAHRIAWDLTHPERLSQGYVVCHSCDHPDCINPQHLFLGSQRENNRDATIKGRAVIKTAAISPAPLIIDDSDISEPGDDIERKIAEEIPQTDIPARRVATEKAFRERDALVVALTKLLPSHLMRSATPDISFGPDWQWIVCVHAPSGEMCWRINKKDLPLYAHLARVEHNYWDGHNTKTKYERLAALKPKKGATGKAVARHVEGTAK